MINSKRSLQRSQKTPSDLSIALQTVLFLMNYSPFDCGFKYLNNSGINNYIAKWKMGINCDEIILQPKKLKLSVFNLYYYMII
jgi:hypothetical protein